MSMHPQPICPVPEDITRVARTAFLKRTTHLQMRDVLGAKSENEGFLEAPRIGG